MTPASPAPAPAPPPSALRRVLRSRTFHVAAPILLVLAIAATIARLDLRPDLRYLHVAVFSGAQEGNYHAIVDRVANAAAQRRGRVDNVTTEGSMDNVARLFRSAGSCEVQFALVQDGIARRGGEWGSPAFELIGRLPRAESVFLLGKDADRITAWSALRGLRIDAGPEGSGTAHALAAIFGARDFGGLELRISHHAITEQLDLAARGEVDLAAVVMDEDAALIDSAVREQGLQIVGIPQVDVVSRRFSFLKRGRIGAGQYDPVRMLPPVDKSVLRLETLVVGNRCASRSQVLGVMRALSDVFPDFIRHNRDTPNTTALELAPAARAYFEHDGPELVDEYFPRVGDVMPPTNWVHVVMGVSILFNIMGFANRFRLWRIDAARVKAEHDLARCFGPGTTLRDLGRLDPHKAALGPEIRREVDRIVRDLETLAARSRRQSLSMLVPMGGEMAYRYQESVIHETLGVLRALSARWDEAPLAA